MVAIVVEPLPVAGATALPVTLPRTKPTCPDPFKLYFMLATTALTTPLLNTEPALLSNLYSNFVVFLISEY